MWTISTGASFNLSDDAKRKLREIQAATGIAEDTDALGYCLNMAHAIIKSEPGKKFHTLKKPDLKEVVFELVVTKSRVKNSEATEDAGRA